MTSEQNAATFADDPKRGNNDVNKVCRPGAYFDRIVLHEVVKTLVISQDQGHAFITGADNNHLCVRRF
jgi:hypothetical protein